jgi:hypothetical protein
MAEVNAGDKHVSLLHNRYFAILSKGVATVSITIFSITTLSIITLGIISFSVSVRKCDTELSIMIFNGKYKCQYAECHYAECHYAECHYAECGHAEVCGALKSFYICLTACLW